MLRVLEVLEEPVQRSRAGELVRVLCLLDELLIAERWVVLLEVVFGRADDGQAALRHPFHEQSVRLGKRDLDREKVGLEFYTLREVPEKAKTTAQRRQYFDTQLSGKGAAGHRFPDRLTEDEKRAVLEYLKTF